MTEICPNCSSELLYFGQQKCSYCGYVLHSLKKQPQSIDKEIFMPEKESQNNDKVI